MRYAFNAVKHAIKQLPRSVRKADRGQEWMAYLPPNISDGDKQAAIEKLEQGTFGRSDLKQLWWKYQTAVPGGKSPAVHPAILPQGARTPGFVPPWAKMEEILPKARHKRKRGEGVAEEKVFKAAEICRDFERVDAGLVSTGDFIRRIRL